jgi:hypothetical protein
LNNLELALNRLFLFFATRFVRIKSALYAKKHVPALPMVYVSLPIFNIIGTEYPSSGLGRIVRRKHKNTGHGYRFLG